MNPFVYPKSRHIRAQTPPQYANYGRYKPYLRQEFSRQCVYCRQPDTIGGQAGFGADHYRPKKDFPQLATAYSNLFYCCNGCNSRKGSYWPDPSRISQDYIPNPCDHEMFQHLRYKEGTVEAKSPAGKFTVEYLDLNDPAAIAYRENILHMIGVLESRIAKLKQRASVIRQKGASGAVPQAVADQDLARNAALLQRDEASLRMLTGA